MAGLLRTSLLLPLAAIRERRSRAVLTGASSAVGFCLFGLMACMDSALRAVGHSGRLTAQVDEGTSLMATLGMLTIVILTSAAISQAVRSRIRQLAVLKTIGYSPTRLLLFVFLEAAIPGALGAVVGLTCSQPLAASILRVVPHSELLPDPRLTGTALAIALLAIILVPILSASVSVIRVIRLDVVTIMSGEP